MSGKFCVQIISKKAGSGLIKKLAAGFEGEIKAVVDVKRSIIAAGCEWHDEARDMLVKNGSDSDDLWGARVCVKSGDIIFKSQINEGRVGAEKNEICDQEIRSEVESVIRQLLI
ncbi:MAG: hypothetical protein HY751_13145 [Nitrospinae bacterium]|nr:hypothetical protein [Nitrospinota bacterium]